MTNKQNAYYVLSMKGGVLDDTYIANQLFWSQFLYLALQAIKQQNQIVYHSDLNKVQQFLQKQAKYFSVKIDPVSAKILQIPKCLVKFGKYIKPKVEHFTNELHSKGSSDNFLVYLVYLIVYTVCLIYYIFWIYHSNFVHGIGNFKSGVG